MSRASDEQILHLIKSRGAQSTAMVAAALEVTPVGARQHLERLAGEGLLEHEDRAESVGRPKRYWCLTAAAHARFPDTHSVLTMELINSVREVFGEPGLKRLIKARETQTLAQYQARVGKYKTLGRRVQALAGERAREGYMAEAQRQRDGSYLLVENHCPICVAATACQEFCRSELDIFQQALGDQARVQRVDHILAGARRCAYQITPEKQK